MKLRANAHTHTTFCDGKNSVEEMTLAAIERGFVALGFSMHGWTPYETTPGLSLEREALYRAEVRRVREKYAGQIEIILGAERDAGFARDFSEYEYLIDSTHWLFINGRGLNVDMSPEVMRQNVQEVFDGDYYAYCRAYYEAEAALARRSDALFLGHIDLVRKFNAGNRYFDEGDPRYLEPALACAEIAARRGLPVEMNTGAISRGWRSDPYPAAPLLRRIRECGGEIIINSDAHSAEALDTGFDLCLDMARQAGFDHVLTLRAAGLTEMGILE